jgi:hypothetical protein
MTAIEGICTMQHFKTYSYIPPKMIAGVYKSLFWFCVVFFPKIKSQLFFEN